jgi:hypothetical protein
VSLHPTMLQSGIVSLGRWGEIVLTGARSALLRPIAAEDVELASDTAEDMTSAVILVDDHAGRLLILPYAASVISIADLTTGDVEEPITMNRDPDFGIRTSMVRWTPDGGIIYLTESDLLYFDAQGLPVWRRSGDFLGWSIEAVTGETVTLELGDWEGNSESVTYALKDGEPT